MDLGVLPLRLTDDERAAALIDSLINFFFFSQLFAPSKQSMRVTIVS
jgi:hypothetical protein